MPLKSCGGCARSAQRLDVAILDPPAFIKRKKDAKEGTLAYQRLNQMAMQVLAKDGTAAVVLLFLPPAPRQPA